MQLQKLFVVKMIYQCGFCEFKCDKNEDLAKHISSSQLEEIKMVNTAKLIQAAEHIEREEAARTMAAMSVVADVAAGPAMPVVAAVPVVAIPAANRPCEICGYIPGTKDKNQQRDRKSHLYQEHYRQRIDLELEATFLAGSKKCPLCDFFGKGKYELTRHYNDSHKIAEKHLSDDINNGRINAGRIIASNVKCQICDLYFEKKSDVDRHVAENHNVQ